VPGVLVVFAVCAFASGFGMRVVDPLILPVGTEFAVPPATAALASTAYALPCALGQPFLGPLGDRCGKLHCIQICVIGLAAAFAWRPAHPAGWASGPVGRSRLGPLGLYVRVFANPKAPWLYGAVVIVGAMVSGALPYVGQLLVEHAGVAPADAPARAGLVLGAFGIGGLAYAAMVRRIIGWLGVRRMCLVGSAAAGSMLALLAVAPWWGACALAMGVAGLSFYMLHNSLQTEATEIAPEARGSAVALFA
jgi:predicted MFS family arabinose efflux permease